MLNSNAKEKGFTLIEVVVTLLLVGITATLAGMWIVNVANGYVFAKMNADTAQKGQLAMTRLAKELSALQSIPSSPLPSGTSITFYRADISYPSGIPVTIAQNGNTVQINVNNSGDNVLTDSVSAFSLAYCDSPNSACQSTWSASSRIIEITLTLMGANNTTSSFTGRATPRNI